jgi:hypothetical protein
MKKSLALRDEILRKINGRFLIWVLPLKTNTKIALQQFFMPQKSSLSLSFIHLKAILDFVCRFSPFSCSDQSLKVPFL